MRHHYKWRLVVVISGWAAVATALNLWPRFPRWWGGFVAGAFAAPLPLILLYLDVTFGIATRQMGLDAEQWTAASLRKLWFRGWRLLHDVRFEAFNVDHVAIGPDRILVIETKWLGAQRDLRRAAGEAAAQAEKAARKIRGFLRGTPRLERTVDPVVLLWGPGVPRDGLPASYIYDVRVVAGHQAKDWRHSLANERGRPDRAAYRALKAYKRRSTVPAPQPSVGRSRQ